MRIAANILIIVFILGLGYVLYSSIEEPIKFNKFYEDRTKQVVKKLENIREAQDYYKAMTGRYASDYDSLIWSLKNDSFPIVKVYETEETALTGEYAYDTTYVAAVDSLASVRWYGALDSLKYVPNGKGEVFALQADTLTFEQALTNVIEVKTTYGVFMGRYADIRYQKYDKHFDPKRVIKFGDMKKPTTSGNWR